MSFYFYGVVLSYLVTYLLVECTTRPNDVCSFQFPDVSTNITFENTTDISIYVKVTVTLYLVVKDLQDPISYNIPAISVKNAKHQPLYYR